MFSSTSSSTSSSGSVRPQAGSVGWLGLSTSTTTSKDNTQRPRSLRGATLPVPANPKESNQGGVTETTSNGSAAGPQPVPAVSSRLGMLAWFGSSSSISSGTGSISAPAERPIVDEPKSLVKEEDKVEPECPVPDKEEEILERERQVEIREKELEERKLVIEQKESELEDRSRTLADREQAGKEEEEEMHRKMEEVERRERELEELRLEFEEEKAKWEKERDMSPPEVMITEEEWRKAMEALKEEMNLEFSVERKKAEERELALETRVMLRVSDILALDKDSKASARKSKWDAAIKALMK
ncbi:hypothetical protein BYT27DRAFT_7202150 [Phlegmacium glaucopus]|nr:hypothetical protein BYT27DRAFT_7202150 [Phlegmacium glaucopus]